jgi:serine/threonine protein kinase
MEQREESNLRQFREFELRGELGRGGAGVVYRAWQPNLQRMVALKVILDDQHTGAEEQARFLREAKATARLNHDGIVQIFDADEHEGRLFMVLELISGGSLHDFLDRTPQPHRWSTELVLKLARVIAYCHNNGIVHRDLKPANILLPVPPSTAGKSSEGSTTWITDAVPSIKVTDFGLARDFTDDSDLTRLGAPMGTPAYMAPEQAAGDVANAGPQADIYSVGAILYRLLTGRPPFASADPFETFERVIHDDPIPPTELVADIPPDLETICLKCLMKNPADRYISAEALADDLVRVLSGEPVAAAPPSMGRRVSTFFRRKPLLGLSLALGIAFYGLHLFAMLVLKSPGQLGMNHGYFTAIIGSVLAAAIAQWFCESERRWLGEAIYALVPVTAMTVAFVIDHGPQSAPLPFYLVMIAASALIAPRSAMIWMVTGACSIGYAGLLLHSYWVAPLTAVPTESAIAFGLCILGMALTVQLLLRRTRNSA